MTTLRIEGDSSGALRIGMSAHKAPEEKSADDESNLCENCAVIDFDDIVARAVSSMSLDSKNQRGVHLYTIGELDHVNEETPCQLCRLFAYASEDTERDTQYKLAAYSLPHISGYGKYWDIPNPHEHSSDSIAFRVYRYGDGAELGIGMWMYAEERCILVTRSDGTDRHGIRGQIIDANCVDYARIQSWISVCKEHHGETCNKLESKKIQGFQVIDCDTNKIVHPLDRCEYVALSYVWGGVEDQWVNGDMEMSNPSPVVADAILVTKQLGYKYLWVDRYCIDQGNAEEKHAQVKKMDVIYMQAELTLIAADGESASVGLPGVGTTPRCRQMCVRLGSWNLTVNTPNMEEVIASCPWSKRAWTYQEGLLSRRRLFFTRHQVYFQCRQTCFSEDPFVPLEVICNAQNLKRMKGRGGVFRGLNNIDHHINQYRIRALSYPSDRLNAILGILRFFESMEEPLLHLCGLPILTGNIRAICEDRHSLGGLLTNCLRQSLLWRSHPGYMKRTEGFPSWSWTGWECDPSKSHPGFSIPRITTANAAQYALSKPSTTIELQMNDGRRIPWTYPRSYNDILPLPDDQSCFLKIRSWLIDCTLWVRKGEDFSQYSEIELHPPLLQELSDRGVSRLPGEDLEDIFPRLKGAREERLCSAHEGRPCKVIVLGLGEMMEPHSRLFQCVYLHCLIVRDIGSHHERVDTRFFIFDDLIDPKECGTGLIHHIGGVPLRTGEILLG